jgi:RNA polymerase sigma-70 factor (ECF subfamily)
MSIDSPLMMLEAMYRKYFRRIYNYAYMRLLNRAAAEDVAQEVFLTAFTAMDRFDSSRGSGAAWLSRIATNLVTDFQKRARNYREISTGEVPEVSFEDSLDDEGTLGNPVNQRIYRILQKLSDGEREFLALRYEMELTNEEIAVNMGLSTNAVSHRYSRLLAKCRQIDGKT